jgi:hypothetical protein
LAKRRITPEERAQWAEAKRRLAERIAYYEGVLREREEQRARRRERLRRFSFGRLGR